MYLQDDTIAAISTPPGSGGIAVLRVSGPNSIFLVARIFRGSVSLENAESHRAYWGHLVEPNGENHVAPNGSEHKNKIIDEVLITVFKGPKSYTTEDVVEISCHGGRHLSARILDLILAQGVRRAEPGEFTLRAYLGGRMDLSQAEAVADLIRAKTDLSLDAALSQFHGVLSERVRDLRRKLIDTCSLLELELDFAEEDVQFADRKDVEIRLSDALKNISDLLATYSRGRIFREGAKLAIVGKPNVGKSTLLNSLLKADRAIVTAIPGTTRDTLEEQLDIRGVPFRIVDTAGIRETDDALEREGVKRSLRQIREADIVLFVFDCSEQIDESDKCVVEQAFSVRQEVAGVENGIVAVLNKIDLKRVSVLGDVRRVIGDYPVVEISAERQLGFNGLEDILIKSSIGSATIHQSDPIVTSARHKESLDSAYRSVELARGSLRAGLSSELVALDMRAALDALGEIIGEVTNEDILGNIFSKFCIGK